MKNVTIRIVVLWGVIAMGCQPPAEADDQTLVGAPFAGPSEKVDAERATPTQSAEDAAPNLPAVPEIVAAKGAAESAPVTTPVATHVPPVPDGETIAQKRKQAWLESEFRCRAISTVRLRKCRFEQTDTGVELKFQKGDVKCADVEWDENGDPARLLGCKSDWLKIPPNNRLKKRKDHNTWSGSHSGWFWKDDKEKYCCPGMWIEGPTGLGDSEEK